MSRRVVDARVSTETFQGTEGFGSGGSVFRVQAEAALQQRLHQRETVPRLRHLFSSREEDGCNECYEASQRIVGGCGTTIGARDAEKSQRCCRIFFAEHLG